MLDAFKHERGKLYPSWQDNPRLKWERALREMHIAGRYEPAPGVVVARVGSDKRNAFDSFQIFVAGQLVESFYMKDREKRYGEIVDALVDIVSEITGEEIMSKQQEPLALSESGAAALRHVLEFHNTKNLDGRTVRSLLDKKLIYDNGSRGWRLTSLGKLSLEAYGGQALEQPEGQRAVMHEHVPDPARTEGSPVPPAPMPAVSQPPELDCASPKPTVDVVTEEATPPQPETEAVVLTRDGAIPVDEYLKLHPGFNATPAQREVVLAEQPVAPAPVERESVVVTDPGRAQRILNYLMSNSPLIRDLVAQLDAVDRATERLRNLE